MRLVRFNNAGTSPGKMSATVGHHFAHPTNHFWKCLYGSQLTERLLSPSEDHTLPDSYRLGLTNLVERPSSQAAELAGTEFTAGVPALLRKIVLKRPHVVCFVGKGIWDSFIKAAATTSSAGASSSIVLDGQASEGNTAISNDSPVKVDTQTRTTSPAKKKRGSLKRTKSSTQSEPSAYDLQPWKVVHSNTDSDTAIRETLFFVVVSTSGLVAGYQVRRRETVFRATASAETPVVPSAPREDPAVHTAEAAGRRTQAWGTGHICHEGHTYSARH
ncbi:uracil-DNA glycosylase-like protein [Trametes elegans]|nr:uracil-DNA glycosylase-like protein [Trametes elegans]